MQLTIGIVTLIIIDKGKNRNNVLYLDLDKRYLLILCLYIENIYDKGVTMGAEEQSQSSGFSCISKRG